jgi:predicted ATPase
MALVISVKKLKGIETLEFSMPPPGAYLLTGANGSGKTTLLTCLHRVGFAGAFQRGFRSSSSSSLDSFSGASVTYSTGSTKVTYSYRESNWAPTPRSSAGLLQELGYPNVVFVAADGARVEPRKDEFNARRVRPASDDLKKKMNDIFDTNRFDHLCYINLVGRGVKAYLMRSPGKTIHYFSEKNFSLGELCVLKLLLTLNEVKVNSLVLIDELEIAVHPRAQTRLFEYLKGIAEQKKLTVIFSTHSVMLIKNVPRKHMLFLERSGAQVSCRRECYPTYVLGHLSGTEEAAPDAVVYVEDDSAKKCAEALIAAHREEVNSPTVPPVVLVTTIGGFGEILRFMDRAPQMLPSNTKRVAALDKDVEAESLAQYRAQDDHAMLALFARLEPHVSYLPWTPEVGLVEQFASDRFEAERMLKARFNDSRIQMAASWAADLNTPTGPQRRKYCKTVLSELAKRVIELTGRTNDRVREELFQLFVTRWFCTNKRDGMKLAAALIP